MTTTPLYPWSPPITGRMKTAPEDFCVFERPATEPEGSGEHLWLEIEKRLLNTEDVAVALALPAPWSYRSVDPVTIPGETAERHIAIIERAET